MRRVIPFLLVLFTVLSCEKQVNEITILSQEQFETKYPVNTVQLVDARTVNEFNAGHINGAIVIDVKRDDFLEKALQNLDKNKPVHLYCKSGSRSMKAAKILAKAGFKEIYSLEGGYLGWKAKQE